MRSSWWRGLVLVAVIGLFLAGCGEGGGDAADDQTDDETSAEDGDDSGGGPEGEGPGDGSAGDGSGEDLGDMLGDGELEDPNEQIENGVYRGNGVQLPVPDGWSVDPAALQQGMVAAVPEDGGRQQLTARAIDTEEAEAAGGGEMELDSLLDSVRQQVDEEADADEEVDLAGADRAHQLTYLELPAPQEDTPSSSTTIVLATDDELVGEFTYSAEAGDYDEGVASRLVEEGGFDPDSEPPPMPQPAPAPEGEEGAGGEGPSGGEGGESGGESDSGAGGGGSGEAGAEDDDG